MKAVEYFHRFKDSERPAPEKLGDPASRRSVTSKPLTAPSATTPDIRGDKRSTNRRRSKVV